MIILKHTAEFVVLTDKLSNERFGEVVPDGLHIHVRSGAERLHQAMKEAVSVQREEEKLPPRRR